MRHLFALQAQDYPGARWSVGLRSADGTAADVDSALAAGHIVRSWPMRGTLHLVAPEDLAWMLALTRPRQATWAAKRRDDLGLSEADLARAGEIARERLRGVRPMRRDDLLAAFREAGIPTTDQRGYHLLWNLAQDGITVFGPMDGAQPTFVLFDEWITTSRHLEGDDALEEFARRYFASHGPATDRDFAWWSSLTLTDARRAIALAGLESREFDGVVHHLPAGLDPARDGVDLLPGFDEYLLGYSDRTAVVAPEHLPRIVPGNNGVFRPTIVDRGEVVGLWSARRLTRRTLVGLDPFAPLPARVQAGIATAVRRYGRFLGTEAELELGPGGGPSDVSG